LLIKERGDLAKLLDRIPIEMQEGQLKHAVREASLIFQQQAKSNARALPHEWTEKGEAGKRGRWGDGEKTTLASSIRRKVISRKFSVVGRTHTRGQARLYAAPVEYGHTMFIPGMGFIGRKVKRSQFWRPAKDSTKGPIHNTIVRILRARVKDMGSM